MTGVRQSDVFHPKEPNELHPGMRDGVRVGRVANLVDKHQTVVVPRYPDPFKGLLLLTPVGAQYRGR